MNYRTPIDIAVALGLEPPTPPPMRLGAAAFSNPIPKPPELVAGILHQGCKMVLGGTSKSNKTWCLLDLALSVAAGQPWWGRPTTKARVLYMNFELPEWGFNDRVETLVGVRPELKDFHRNWVDWQLRGEAADFSRLRPHLQRQLDRYDFGLIVVDPAYKLLGDRDENANGDIADLMNEFERLAQSTGAAVAIAHHFAKGDPSVKDPIDRMSGAGAWARDPDCILVLTPHEEEDCFTVSSILRNLPSLPEFVVEWRYPRMLPARSLDPQSLRRRTGRKKLLTDREFVHQVISGPPRSYTVLIARAEAAGISETTARRFCTRLVDSGLIKHVGDLYWAAEPEASDGSVPGNSQTEKSEARNL